MKNPPILFLLILIILSTCKNQPSSKTTKGPMQEEYPAGAVALTHTWTDFGEAAYPLNVPSPDEIEEWKRFFTMTEEQEPPSEGELRCYKSPGQYLAVRDLMEVWLWQEPDSQEDITLWRLLQIDTTAVSLPVDEKVFHIRDQIDSLLDYNTGINVEMSNRAVLREKLYGFYNDLVLRCLLTKVSDRVAVAMMKEQEAWLAYHSAAIESFRKVNDSSGSAFTQWLYEFGAEDHKLRRRSQEGIFFVMCPGDLPFTIDREIIPSISDEQLAAEYEGIAKDLVDWSIEGLGLNVKEQRATLEKERKAWNIWMQTRKNVSSLLPDEYQEVYDYATYLVRQEKLAQMKERIVFL